MRTFEKHAHESEASVAPKKIDSGVVEKYFHSERRRFRKGDIVARADISGSHLDFDHMVERGFIVAAPAPG